MSQTPSLNKAEDIVHDTLYSALHRFATPSASTSSLADAPHPFGSSAHALATAELRDLIAAAEQASLALGHHFAQSYADPKLVSILKQHTAISHALYQADAGIRQTVDVLKAQVDTRHYGEDVPGERAVVPEWCIARLEAWGKAVGMEIFKEEQNSHMVVVLGGKVLVIDIDLAIDRATRDAATIDVASVKTSYAVPGGADGATTTGGSVSLAGFISDSLKAYLNAAQQGVEELDVLLVETLGLRIRDSLAYLMRVDELAAVEGDGGLRWFTAMDDLALIVEGFAAKESRAVSHARSATEAQLDIFLSRAHPLPLPYLAFPSISFLVYLSPLSYLTLHRASPAPGLSTDSKLPGLDISFNVLRKHLSNPSGCSGTTIATLCLAPPGTLRPPFVQVLPTSSFRPTFPLDDSGSTLTFVFPQVEESSTTHDSPMWTLDFTDGGRRRGVVMTQSGMHEVEHALNPMSGFDPGRYRIGMNSWLDLLFQHYATNVSPAYWNTIYRSPTSAHPPLHLRLKAPDENGFILDRVPVRTLKEVWAILEIVREQCWLNEQLCALSWTPEGSVAPQNSDSDADDVEADLAALLAGTYTPRQIPVAVTLPHLRTPPPSTPEAADDDALFGGDVPGLGLSSAPPPAVVRPRHAVVMVAPARSISTGAGAVEVRVVHDENRERGVYVEVARGMRVGAGVGAEVAVREEKWEEVVRRGGAFGIPGRLWAS